MNRASFAFLASCFCAFSGVTYQVTEGGSVCTEVRIPKWTRPSDLRNEMWRTDSWGCEYDIRRQANRVYVGLSCGSSILWRMQEKYAVDLGHPGQIRKTDQSTWEAASVLEPDNGAGFAQYQSGKQPFKYRGKAFLASGPKWGGAAPSPGGSRIAINSWSGTIRDPPNLMEYTGGLRKFMVDSIRAHSDGHYWIDIYDVRSALALIQIRGDFHGDKPEYFQAKAKWLNGGLYVVPLEPEGMRRLLVCDVDAAAKTAGVDESDASVPLAQAKPFLNHSRSDCQMRFFYPSTPQARITGFHDQPVYRQGSSEIEAIKVSTLLDVQVPGHYSLLLAVDGMQERAQADLSAGHTEISIRFPASHFDQNAGPSTITWAQLTRYVADGMILADDRLDPEPLRRINTGALLLFTGKNSVNLTRGNGSGPDRLEVHIGLHAEDTECQGSGWLQNVPDPNGQVYSTPDGQTLVLIFSGRGLYDQAAFRIRQVEVRCRGHSIRADRIDIAKK